MRILFLSFSLLFVTSLFANGSYRNFMNVSYLKSIDKMDILPIGSEVITPSIDVSGIGVAFSSQPSKNFSFGIKILSLEGSSNISYASSEIADTTIVEVANSVTMIGPLFELIGDLDPLRISVGIWPSHLSYRKTYKYSNGLYALEESKSDVLGQSLKIALDFSTFLLALNFTQYSSISSENKDMENSTPPTIELMMTYSWGNTEGRAK